MSKEREKESLIEVPKTSKTLTIVKWSEAFVDLLSSIVDVRTNPLSHATRDDSMPSGTLLPLASNMPNSEVCGSVED